MSAELSGRDLAREALRQHFVDAKKRGTERSVSKKPRRLTTVRTRDGRDPLGLGTTLEGLFAARGWETSHAGGNLIDRWPSIAPELAEHVTAEHYDAQQQCLHLRTLSPAFATQINLLQNQLVQRINTAMGGHVVRSVKILRSGIQTRQPAANPAATPGGRSTSGPGRRDEPAPAPPNEALAAARAEAKAARARRIADEAERIAALRSPYQHLCPTAREPESQFVAGVRAREEAEAEARIAADLRRRGLTSAHQEQDAGEPTPLRTLGAA